MCVGVAPMYLCTMFAPGVCGGRQRALNLLELELYTVVRHNVGDGSQTHIFGRAANIFND